MILDLADKLIDRAVELFQYRKTLRRETYDAQVAPTQKAFEALHESYLASFARYRKQISETPELIRANSPLLEEIRTENLYSAHTRTALLQLAAAGKSWQLESFDDMVNAEAGEEIENLALSIRNYLPRARAGSTQALFEACEQQPGHFMSQRFRNSLIEDLEAVIAENWAYCLDPSASEPPLSPDEIVRRVAEVANTAGLKDSDPDLAMRIRQVFALRAIDVIVEEMQEAYAAVSARFHEARLALGA